MSTHAHGHKIKRSSGYSFRLDLSPNWQPIIDGKERSDLGCIASSEADAINRIAIRLNLRAMIHGDWIIREWERDGKTVSKIFVSDYCV